MRNKNRLATEKMRGYDEVLVEWIHGIAPLSRPRVVVLGAGFGGLWAARKLSEKPVEVLLLDRNNYHVFLPLLYQVGTAELEPEEIAVPVRSIIAPLPNVHFAMGEVEQLDLTKQVVKTDRLTIPYDYLVIALGSITRYMDVKGAEEYGFPLKSLAEGVALRSHILRCFEDAVNETDTATRKRKLTFVIVGGGATGVEFTGALMELIHGPLVNDFTRLNPDEITVHLIQADHNILPGFSDYLREHARRQLHKRGVSIHLETRVIEITPIMAELDTGEKIATETIVWSSGVRGDKHLEEWGLPVTKSTRVEVDESLRVKKSSNVYAIGDNAAFFQNGEPLPMIAPVAIQQAEHAANNIVCQALDQPVKPFVYKDPGSMVAISRNSAVVQFGNKQFTGFIAWALWLIVHIYKLIGFRNRLQVMIKWAWDYMFYERAVRLILPWGPACGSHQGECKKLRTRPAPSCKPER